MAFGGGGFGGGGLTGGISGAVAGIANTAAGAGVGLATSGLGVLEARRANELQRRFVRQQLKRGHVWEVAGLRAAGLNPILSATRGTSATGAGNIDPSAPLGRAQSPDLVGGVRKGVAAALELKSFKADAKRREAEAEDAYHRVFNTTQTNLNLEKEHDRLAAEISRIRASARYVDTQERLLSLQEPSARAVEELYRKNPKLRMMREFVNPISPSLRR